MGTHGGCPYFQGYDYVRIIRQYQERDREAWELFVREHPDGTVFHSIDWKEVIEATFGHRAYYLIAGETGGSGRTSAGMHNPTSGRGIVGILPLFIIRSPFFGKHLISVPFAELGGPLTLDKEAARELVGHAISYTKETELDYLELRARDLIPADLKRKELYVNFSREILKDLDENLQAIPRKARRMVRQGEKYNLSCELGTHNLHIFYEILARNYHDLGTPVFPWHLFKNFCRRFGDKCNIMIVFDNNHTPIAGVLFFLYKDRILPYYAGSLTAYRNLAPNDYMYWQLMKFGWEQGYRVFDFGRSKINTGSYHFKRHWGFEPVPLQYQYYLNTIAELPNLSPANPKYKRKIALWRRLPFCVTKIAGPPIARYLV